MLISFQATLYILSSLNVSPINWIPTGSPSLLFPPGIDNAGTVAKFIFIVYISAKYIAVGSSHLSPILNGSIGETGPSIISYFLNASLKSCFNFVLNF